MVTIAIFASSLTLTSVFVLAKAIEIKYKKRNSLLKLLSKLDIVSVNFLSVFKFKILQILQSIRYIILVKTKVVCINLSGKIIQKIVNEYKARQSIIMGQKNITNKGSVSFYLKKITEGKGDKSGRKIEDVVPQRRQNNPIE